MVERYNQNIRWDTEHVDLQGWHCQVEVRYGLGRHLIDRAVDDSIYYTTRIFDGYTFARTVPAGVYQVRGSRSRPMALCPCDAACRSTVPEPAIGSSTHYGFRPHGLVRSDHGHHRGDEANFLGLHCISIFLSEFTDTPQLSV